MIKELRYIGLLVALVVIVPCAGAVDLQETYRIALQADPNIRKAQAARLAMRESKSQAVGALLPQITANAGYEWQESRDIRSNPLPPFGQADFDEINEQQSYRWGLELRQTLFRWDEWVRVKQADKRQLKADVDLRTAELDLIIRVAEAYFSVLTEQAALESVQAARQAIEDQLKESRDRFEVGFRPLTDVQEAEAGRDEAVAEEIRAKRNLSNAIEALREIIDRDPGDLRKPSEQLPLAVPDPVERSAWVELALEQNYSIQSARLGAEIARDSIAISRSGHLPTIDLVGSYTDSDLDGDRDIDYRFNGGPFFNQSGPLDGDREENILAIQLSLPLFSGGTTVSRAREANYQFREAMEQLEITTRQVKRQTRNSFEDVVSDIAEVQATERALRSAEIALEATETDYEEGTRTSVDLLESRRRLFNAQTNYARSRHTYIVNALKLKRAAGTLAFEDVSEVNGWLETSPW